MSSEDSRLTPDPRSSAIGDLTNSLRSRVDDARSWVGDFGQRIETRDTLSPFGGHRSSSARKGKRAEQIEPPRDAYSKFRNQYDTTPLLSAPIDQMESDVVADGWRVKADDDRTQEFLEMWGKQCAIVAGEPNKDIIELIALWSKVLDIYGDALTENVPALERPDAIAALKMIPPATMSYHTLPGSEMLLQPGHTEYAPYTTQQGDAAAYTQYSKDANELWTDGDGQQLDPRHFSFEQITRSVRNPDPGSVTGKSAIEQVSEQVEMLKHHFRNDEVAIESSAWKQIFVGFKPLIERLPNGVEIRELSEEAKGHIESNIESAEPGEVVTYDGGGMDIQEVSGDVADIVDRYNFFVDYVLAAMPAPKYSVGFEKNINQFVTERQEIEHNQRVVQRKEKAARTFTPVFERIATQHGYDPSGIEFVLEPPADDSPVRSLDDGEMGRLLDYSKALKNISGSAAPTTLIKEDALLDLVLQLSPEDVALEQESVEVDEQDPETQAQMAALNGDSGE